MLIWCHDITWRESRIAHNLTADQVNRKYQQWCTATPIYMQPRVVKSKVHKCLPHFPILWAPKIFEDPCQALHSSTRGTSFPHIVPRMMHFLSSSDWVLQHLRHFLSASNSSSDWATEDPTVAALFCFSQSKLGEKQEDFIDRPLSFLVSWYHSALLVLIMI